MSIPRLPGRISIALQISNDVVKREERMGADRQPTPSTAVHIPVSAITVDVKEVSTSDGDIRLSGYLCILGTQRN